MEASKEAGTSKEPDLLEQTSSLKDIYDKLIDETEV